jgi:hypothetical protein
MRDVNGIHLTGMYQVTKKAGIVHESEEMMKNKNIRSLTSKYRKPRLVAWKGGGDTHFPAVSVQLPQQVEIKFVLSRRSLTMAGSSAVAAFS